MSDIRFLCNDIIFVGTFSTVFKAIDLHTDRYDNSQWLHTDLQYEENDTTGELAIAELFQYEPYVNSPEHYSLFCDVPLGLTEKWRKLMKSYIDSVRQKPVPDCPPMSSESDDLEYVLPRPKFRRIPNYVALKRINNTSAPDRVFDEVDFIRRLQYAYIT